MFIDIDFLENDETKLVLEKTVDGDDKKVGFQYIILQRKLIWNIKEPKTIETERLLLRLFNINDAEAMYRNQQSDSNVTEFLCWKTATDISRVEYVLLEWIKGYESPDFYQWAIVLKEVGVNRIESQYDPNNPGSGKVMEKCG